MHKCFIILGCLLLVSAKIYNSCELAKELKNKHGAPINAVTVWVCIAKHESNFDTRSVSKDDNRNYGLFQISHKYCCSQSGKGKACYANCAEFKNDDISDDFKCAKIIFDKHLKKEGDGFKAWSVYEKFCKGPNATEYVKGCF